MDHDLQDYIAEVEEFTAVKYFRNKTILTAFFGAYPDRRTHFVQFVTDAYHRGTPASQAAYDWNDAASELPDVMAPDSKLSLERYYADAKEILAVAFGSAVKADAYYNDNPGALLRLWYRCEQGITRNRTADEIASTWWNDFIVRTPARKVSPIAKARNDRAAAWRAARLKAVPA